MWPCQTLRWLARAIRNHRIRTSVRKSKDPSADVSRRRCISYQHSRAHADTLSCTALSGPPCALRPSVSGQVTTTGGQSCTSNNTARARAELTCDCVDVVDTCVYVNPSCATENRVNEREPERTMKKKRTPCSSWFVLLDSSSVPSLSTSCRVVRLIDCYGPHTRQSTRMKHLCGNGRTPLASVTLNRIEFDIRMLAGALRSVRESSSLRPRPCCTSRELRLFVHVNIRTSKEPLRTYCPSKVLT